MSHPDAGAAPDSGRDALPATPPSASLDEALAAELDTLERAGLRRTLRTVEHRRGAAIVLDGKPAVDFSSNDYLGLAGDERLASAAASMLQHNGTGAAAARLISGNHPVHAALEFELARFKRTEAALLFPSGYAANIGAIPALMGRRDVIYADALNHASLIDAARLARAEVRVFPHLHLASLERMLTDDAGRFRRRLIVVDGMFSMDGDLFPLDELVPLAREHNAWTYIDDAHATGVLGATGRGSAEHFGVEGQISMTMGTLGKALGTSGAFIAGSFTLVEYLLNRARAFVFTTGSPPAIAAAALEALAIVQREPWRRDALRDNARRLRRGLAAMGRPADGDESGYVVPVLLGGAEETMRVGLALREHGFLVGAVRPPTVPMGTSRLRITLSAAHDTSQIDALLDALRDTLRPSGELPGAAARSA